MKHFTIQYFSNDSYIFIFHLVNFFPLFLSIIFHFSIAIFYSLNHKYAAHRSTKLLTISWKGDKFPVHHLLQHHYFLIRQILAVFITAVFYYTKKFFPVKLLSASSSRLASSNFPFNDILYLLFHSFKPVINLFSIFYLLVIIMYNTFFL